MTVSFDKVLRHHAYDCFCDDDPLESTNRWESLTKCGPVTVSFDKGLHHEHDNDEDLMVIFLLRVNL